MADLVKVADAAVPLRAICDRPVERIDWHTDHILQATVWTVYCHGDQETVSIDDRDLCDGLITISPGLAFSTKRLPA